MAVRSQEPHDEPEIELLRAFARALIAAAEEVREVRLNSDPETYSDRFKLRKKVGPHRVTGRPCDPNPVLEGRDLRSITRDSKKDSR
jgi:hypothetical protein